MLHPVTLALKHDQVPVMHQAVDHRRGHLFIREDPAPFREFQIRRQDQALALIAV